MARKIKTEKKEEPGKGPAEKLSANQVMLRAALEIARQTGLNYLLLYVDCLEEDADWKSLVVQEQPEIILVARAEEANEKALLISKKVVRIPPVNLTRMGQIKIAAMLSFSNRYIAPGDRFVFLTGLEKGKLDTIMVMEVGREYEMFQTVDQPPLTEHIRRAVFERVFNLSLELASEGREGKPVGAIFVLGDSAEVLLHTKQNIINPFKGYPENERNVLDDAMRETLKEFSTIDGAFVIKGTGTIVSAGTYLLPKLLTEDLPQGLGARHAAAAAITAATHSIAITISESTGTVRIWRQGAMITEIEKAKRGGGESR